jgi:hypothetical protein
MTTTAAQQKRAHDEAASRSAKRVALSVKVNATRIASAAKAKRAAQVARVARAAKAARALAARQARARLQRATAARQLKVRQAKSLAAQRAVRARAAARRKTNGTLPRPSAGSPKAYARSLIGSGTQYGCLVLLWTRESGWNYQASNGSSGAYGIPQSLPGSKMASAGADWRTNPATQIRWGLSYIKSVYGTPCGAWAHSQATNWY